MTLKTENNGIKEGDTLTADGKTYQFVKNPSDVKAGNIAVQIDDDTTEATKAKNTAKNLAGPAFQRS